MNLSSYWISSICFKVYTSEEWTKKDFTAAIRKDEGATTLSIKTFSIMTLSILAFINIIVDKTQDSAKWQSIVIPSAPSVTYKPLC
jgi:hypothetical protein